MRLCPKHKPGAYAAVIALVAVAALLLLRKPELLNAYTYSDRIYDRNGQLLHLGLSLDDSRAAARDSSGRARGSAFI